jgi:hypothetical protein
VVVIDGETVKLFPVPTKVPPHELVYQLSVEPIPLAVSTVVAPAQIEGGFALAVICGGTV